MSEVIGQVAPGCHASAVWLNTINLIMHAGRDVSPRGKATREMPQHTVTVDLNHPLVFCPARKLSIKFAAAEALWMLAGSNQLEELAKYAPRMREFSDDGITLAGAYGPMIVSQLDYVISKLVSDRDTRQAVMVIWRPNPPTSKDVPCTVALDFKIRADRLNCHVFMRSSDAWLGLPYDTFSFSTIAAYVACRYNAQQQDVGGDPIIELGNLYLTAASSHLYATNFDNVRDCLEEGSTPRGWPVFRDAISGGDWARLERELTDIREGIVTAPWGPR